MLTQLAEYLQAKGLGTYDDEGVTGNIFIARLPASPDNIISIYPTGGGQPDMKLGYDTPTIQIIIRAGNPVVAYNNAQAIYNELHGITNLWLTSEEDVWVVSCQGIQSSPVFIGEDKSKRDEFSINFQFEIRNQNTNRE